MMHKKSISVKTMLVLLGLSLFITSAVGALSVVWLRQQISGSAERCIALEKKLVAAQRHYIDLEASIARSLSPESLRSRIGKKLSLPQDDKVVWVKAPKMYQAIASKMDYRGTIGG